MKKLILSLFIGIAFLSGCKVEERKTEIKPASPSETEVEIERTEKETRSH